MKKTLAGCDGILLGLSGRNVCVVAAHEVVEDGDEIASGVATFDTVGVLQQAIDVKIFRTGRRQTGKGHRPIAEAALLDGRELQDGNVLMARVTLDAFKNCFDLVQFAF